jgi:hypothetical protein
MAVKIGALMLAAGGSIASVDINPVMLFERGRGAMAADALIERSGIAEGEAAPFETR